ncbi:FxSxx-COOH system tetratricopeptide repeat protein [Streptomyces sp. YIM 98790]|uniref:FxSxx-COOH system tetratricopeptide repeat protein n=1 Tax=Streptomyces sp. YIM 98790 TaxID=2689077 RepID=UPI0028BDA1D6|nr:FxSxx-COOH system tetratricopeptide repeat protein [Streptomyces sp. YIM 98790]
MSGITAGHGPVRLARAFSRLSRRVPSRSRSELDEERTARCGLADDLWLPWVRPAEERAFELVVLTDASPTMRIWHDTVAGLALEASRSGAFRDVRTIPFSLPAPPPPASAAGHHGDGPPPSAGQPDGGGAPGGAAPAGRPPPGERHDGEEVRLGRGVRSGGPGELIDASGRRIFLVVTDGLSHGWAGPAADGLLRRLAGTGPLALVHLLPTYLWHRSSLSPHRARLDSGGPGAPNRRIGHTPPDDAWPPVLPVPEPAAPHHRTAARPAAPGPGPVPVPVPVPVLSLKPGPLTAWAELVTGNTGVRRTLPVVLAGTLARGRPAPGLRAPRADGPRAAAAAVSRFVSLATPTARRLALQLAAAPFDFPLIAELRDRAVPEAGPDHLAEILMGGLIDWEGGDGRPDFADGIREALLAQGTRTQLAATVDLLAGLPGGGRRGSLLQAALRDPDGTALPPPAPADPSWLRTELAVLKALSGPYARRAARVAGHLTGATHGAHAPPEGSGGPSPGRERAESVPDATGDGVPATPADAPAPATGPEPGSRNGSGPGSGNGPEPGSENGPEPETENTDTPHARKAVPHMELKAPDTRYVRTGQPKVMGNVPPKNPNFVGRESLLAAVEEQLRGDATAAVLPHALHGMGGVGKSQIAIEYVYRHSHEYNVIWWVPSEQESLILGALADLARNLGLDVGPQANTAVPAVREALRTGKPYDNWLLIFDNAENIDTVRSYFPTGGPGKIIVTSRNRDWERVATPLTVNVFEREESVALLRRRSRDLSAEDADLLADALGDLPLAVEQAGAWHATTGMPVAEYLDLLEQRRPGVLELDPSPDYPISVAAAWNISLDRLADTNPAARQLLEICACMAPEPVPLTMLRGSRNVEITPELDPVLRDPVLFARATRDLSKLSLIRLDHKNGTLQMHRLMHTVITSGLSRERTEVMRHAGHVLLAMAKPGAPEAADQWPAYQALLPHIMASGAVRSGDPWVRELVHDSVLFLYYWGAHEAGAELAREAWTRWNADSGEEDALVLKMAKLLAFLLRLVGSPEEAFRLNEQALDVSRRASVPEEELIDSMWQMAGALRFRGEVYAARDLDREADGRARDMFGPEDPAALLAAHSYGVSLRLSGEFALARELDEETVNQWELLYGPHNALTLNTRNGLTIDMREAGDYPGARAMQEDIYATYRSVFGEDNAATVRAARNLAVCRRRDGALEEAAALTEDCLQRFTVRYGADHPDTLTTAVNALVDRRLRGDLEGSREIGEQTLARFRATLGPDHPYTLLTMADLAATLRAQGEAAGAEELDTEAGERFRRTLGERHVWSLTAALGRASGHYARLDFAGAREIDEATLPLLEEVCGTDHPVTLAARANLALDLRGLGEIERADRLNTEAVAGFTRVLRPDHPWLMAARLHQRIECDLAPAPL